VTHQPPPDDNFDGDVSGDSDHEASTVGETHPAEPQWEEAVDEVAAVTTGKLAALVRRSPKALLEWFVIIAIAVTSAIIIRSYVVQTFYIPSGSMEPTLMVGDRIVVSKLSLDFSSIHRGDILVFRRPPSENCGGAPVSDLVKRVIGLPGDHVSSNGNTIYINGHALNESWSHIEPLGGVIGNVTVPAGRYFMMGDNHPNSCDSRSWGTISRSYVVGRVVMRIWPLSHVTIF
jgi:signal peptidase I